MSETLPSVNKKTKKDVADQVGRITTKLAKRARNLEGAENVYEKVRWNNGVVVSGLDSVKAINRGSTTIQTSESKNDGSVTVAVRKANPETGVSIHQALATEGRHDSWIKSLNKPQRASTDTEYANEAPTDGIKRRSISMIGSEQIDNHYGPRVMDIRTQDESSSGRIVSDDENTLLDTKIPTKELVDQSTRNAAHSLSAIRGSIAEAEIEQRTQR